MSEIIKIKLEREEEIGSKSSPSLDKTCERCLMEDGEGGGYDFNQGLGG